MGSVQTPHVTLRITDELPPVHEPEPVLNYRRVREPEPEPQPQPQRRRGRERDDVMEFGPRPQRRCLRGLRPPEHIERDIDRVRRGEPVPRESPYAGDVSLPPRQYRGRSERHRRSSSRESHRERRRSYNRPQ